MLIIKSVHLCVQSWTYLEIMKLNSGVGGAGRVL